MKHTLSSYLEDLEARLPLLTEPQRVEIIAEYRAHITAEITAGTPEHEVLRKFGKPAKVAHQFYTTYGVYEWFRKWQFATLAFMAILAVGMNWYAFGNPAKVLNGSIPPVWLWNLSYFVIGPMGYWWFTYRCRSQRVIPMLITFFVLLLGFAMTNLPMANASNGAANVNFALLPKTTEEAMSLSAVSTPLEQLAKAAANAADSTQFAKLLSSTQQAVVDQQRYLRFDRTGSGTFLIPMTESVPAKINGATVNFMAVRFAFTDNSKTALAAWKRRARDIDSLVSQTRPSVIEFTTGLRSYTIWYLLSRSASWVLAGQYFGFVAGVGLLASQLPPRRNRRRSRTSSA
jgi:hypothetical protein